MIKFFKGDLLTSNADIIAHQTNCKGVMGAGIAKQIKAKYPNVYYEYKKMCDEYYESGDSRLLLGVVQFVPVNNNQLIANCFAQWGYNSRVKQTQDKYFQQCMKTLLYVAQTEKLSTVAIPYKMGCGLAGGDWDRIIYPIIQSVFENSSIALEVWQL